MGLLSPPYLSGFRLFLCLKMETVMKRIAFVLIMLLFTLQLNAQTVVTKESYFAKVAYTFTADSAESLTSDQFNVSEYDGLNLISNPNSMSYSLATLGDTLKCNIYLYATSNGISTVIDTLAAITSVDTNGGATASSLVLFNQNNKKADSYYLSVVQQVSGDALTSSKIVLYYPKKEEYSNVR